MCNSEWFSEVELLEPAGQIKLNLCLYGWIKIWSLQNKYR